MLYFSAEDSTKTVLKNRLINNKANLQHIHCIDLDDPLFPKIRFDSDLFAELITAYKPALCIFDPIQSFLPSHTDMIARADMQKALSYLQTLCSRTNTAFMLVVHTNKKAGVYGRNRLADSACIWDTARSVLMLGRDGSGTGRYVSHEKSNYSACGKTILFQIGNPPVFVGTCDEKDEAFVKGHTSTKDEGGKRRRIEAVKNLIVEFLKDAPDNKLESNKLEEKVRKAGYSKDDLKKAKAELLNDGWMEYKKEGYRGKTFCRLSKKMEQTEVA